MISAKQSCRKKQNVIVSSNMPITQSAKKAVRQSLRRKKRNLGYKIKIKKLLKEAKNLIAQKKNEEAKKLLPQIYKAVDKAAKIGVIKKNTAARRKSRITKLISTKFKAPNPK